MTHVAVNNLGAIIDTYADVIDGGNSWAGGTSYRGIPGSYSNDPGLRSGEFSTITAIGTGYVGFWVYVDNPGRVMGPGRWVREDAPGYFLRSTASVDINSADNVGSIRRITDWNYAALYGIGDTEEHALFVVDTFPAGWVAGGDTFQILQGFKRIPNADDIFSDDSRPDGLDRMYSLELIPAARLAYYGNGVETWQGVLRLSLRILAYGRQHDAAASAVENIITIRSALTRGSNPNHRPTNVVALMPPAGSPEFAVKDSKKVVIVDQFPIMYRIDRSFT